MAGSRVILALMLALVVGSAVAQAPGAAPVASSKASPAVPVAKPPTVAATPKSTPSVSRAAGSPSEALTSSPPAPPTAGTPASGPSGGGAALPPSIAATPTGFRYTQGMVMEEEIVMSLVENGEQKTRVFEAEEDAYDGVIVHIKGSMDSNHFVAMLRASISQWRKQGKKGVWIKLPIEHSNLVNAAVKDGFWYHHAEPTYLMLVYWIPETPPTIPANASHRVGIGAFVMKDNGEVLMVQEKKGTFKGTGVWKMPTGVVDEGEDICDAAVREVQEETGIKAEFLELLAFRQSHKSFFGKSDLVFVCMLKPLSYKIQKQDSEIEGAQWMPIEEYAAQPFIKKHGMFNKIAEICLAKKENKYDGFSTMVMTSAFSAKKNYLYCNQKQVTLPVKMG